MKTPAEFEPIAVWMGWEKQEMPNGVTEWWGLDAEGLDDFKGYVSRKTSLTDAEAVEVLNRLVEKGYSPLLFLNLWGAWTFEIRKEGQYWAVAYGSTIAAAVEEALSKLIAAEGGKE